jgi:RsiW-degrading membrane proteinase PrsW (M82 family)
MKNLLHNNNYLTGVIGVVVSELLCALLVYLVLLIFNLPLAENARWFALAFIPPILLLRYYAKNQDYPDTLKAVITTVFVTAIAYFWFMLKNHYITFN